MFKKENRKEIEKLRKEIEKLREKEKILFTLQEITADLVSILKPKEIYQKTANAMINPLGYVGSIIFLVEKKEKQIRSLAVSSIKGLEWIIQLLPKSVYEYTSPLDEKNPENLVVKCAINGKIIENPSFAEFVCPPLSKKIANFAQRITGGKRLITLPIIVKGEIIGVLLFGSKKNYFAPDEIEILKTFANQVGIAINNAKLYDIIKKQKQTLEDKVKERTKEIEEKSKELEKWYNLTVGRELRMIELKQKIKELEKELEKGPKQDNL